jgi:integrase
MPHRKASNGRINPFRVAKKRRLRDGSEKEYTVWRAKIDVGETRTGARRQRTVEAPTRRECEAKARDMLKEIRDYGVAADRHATLGKYARQWLKTKMEMVDHKSYQTYETAVYVHLADYLDTPLSKFTPTMVTGILRDAKAHDKRGRETGPAGTSARRKIKTTLGQIMKLAVADGIIKSNPVDAAVIPVSSDVAAKELARQREAFTEQQVRAMLDAAAGLGIVRQARWWMRILSAMRQGETLGARIDDLAFVPQVVPVEVETQEPQTVTITDDQGVERTGTSMRRSVKSVDKRVLAAEYQVNWKLQEIPKTHGCGEPENGRYPCGRKRGVDCPYSRWRVPEGYDMLPVRGRWCLSRPKSHTGRIVPLVPMLAQLLAAYMKETEQWPNPAGLLFRHEDGSPITPREDSEEFQSLLLAAGVEHPERRTTHELRHSIVTLLARMGVPYSMIKQIVGHSSDAMIEHYRHADAGERLRAMETLDDVLGLKELGD